MIGSHFKRTTARRRTLAICLVLIASLCTLPIQGKTKLVLIDGRVLEGTAVRREGGDYILTLESGDEVTMPAQLVESVSLAGDDEPESRYNDGSDPLRPPGFRRAEPENLGGSPPPEGAPSGMVDKGPQQLAGDPVRPSRPSEQTKVLGEPSRFQNDIVDNSWTPSTDWDMDPEKNNNWAPSEWSEDIVDHSWEPKSAWDNEKDVMESSRSQWQKAPIDSSWKPTDGFNK